MAMMNLLCLVSSFFLLFTYCDSHLIRNKREALRKVQCQETVKSLDLTGEGEGVLTLQTETFQGSYNDSKGNVNEYSFDAYKPNQNCLFDVFTNTGTQMVWTSDEFAIEESDDCMFDYLEIEGKKFCGWKPLIYITKSSYVGSVFKSDESYEDRGYTFVIKEQKVDTLTYCNNTVSGDGSKTITNSIDPAGQNCFYRIETADKNKVVQLTLEKVNFESTNCEEESVIIYEGQSSHGQKKEVICPNTTQQVFPFHAKAFFIEYRNLLNSEREEAFKIRCDFVEDNFLVTTPAPTTASPVGGNNDCSGRFINSEMVYTSPYMENNKHCVIVIRNTMLAGHIVQAKFEYFDIEDSENCSFDSLQIYSGEREESDPLGGPYCGDSLNGRIITSRGNSLRLEFKTDESFALRGFKVDISFKSAYDCSCENNKICIQQGYEKLCLAGKECDSQYCLDKGRCVEYKGNKKCYCNPGYDGEYCSIYTDNDTDQPLRFKTAPTNRKIEKGKSIHPVCELDVAQGVEVHYEWTLNGQSIADYNDATGFGALPGGVLSIKEFSEDYDGQYMCIGRTKFGSAEHIFRYETVSKCEVVITSGPGDVQWNVGQSVLLPCHVNTGRGSVQINWKKDGIPIDLSVPRYEIISQSYLQISELELNDAGSYSCHVEDKNGCPSSKKGTLKIIDYKPLNDYCGISTWDETLIPQVRLSKSEKSRLNEDPWYVNFRTKAVRGKQEITFCGGSLISQKYVLTAAHCISGFDSLDYGAFSTSTVSLSLGTISCLGGGVQRSFRKYTIHPRFNNTSYDNDIALIELDSPVEYDASIRPICLADKTAIDKTFFEDARSRAFRTVGRVVGCGRRSTTGPLHDFLQFLHIEYVPEEKCEESFLKNNLTKTSSMFCAGSEVARKGDACGGDSGSPFVMYDNRNRRIQTGIVSWGVGCDVANFSGVYTNVGMFYDWITEITDFDTEKVENFLG